MKRFLCALALTLWATSAFAQAYGTSIVGGGANFPVPNFSTCNFILPTTFNNVWYLDPVNGFAQNDYTNGTGGAPLVTAIGGANGQGTQTHPWNSLQAVFSTVTGYPRPLLTTASGGSGTLSPIAPGDEVLLNTGPPGTGAGTYGTITTGNANTSSGVYLVISGAPGQTPVLNAFIPTGASNIALTNVSIGFTPGLGSGNHLIFMNGATTKNIIVDHVTAASDTLANQQTWTTNTTWAANASTGFQLGAGSCIQISNSHINVVWNAITIDFGGSKFNIINNTIDHFADDGMDVGGNDEYVHGNMISDPVNLTNLSSHIDLLQGITGGTNVTIDGNTLVLQTDPSLLFTGLPGINGAIDITNDSWERLQITNNIISMPANFGHGISIGCCTNDTLIANNTVPDAAIAIVSAWNPTTGATRPSSNIIVKNNIAAQVTADTAIPTQTSFNTILNVGATNEFACNGSIVSASAAGSYSCNNVIDVGSSTQMGVEITAWNNTNAALSGVPAFTYNAHLVSGAPARSAGTTTLPTPQADQRGRAMNSPPDTGALQFP